MPFHIIGHSMGGLDARYLASILNVGPRHKFDIRSITTLSSPHRGSLIANLWLDFFLSKRNLQFNLNHGPISKGEHLLRSFFFWASTLMDANAQFASESHPPFVSFDDNQNGLISPLYKNLFHTLYHLSPEFMMKIFNTNVPNLPQVQYFSLGGDISKYMVRHVPLAF